jgi:hypothetical protein
MQVNTLRMEDRSTWPRARQIARRFMSQKNGESQLAVYAVGHCRIK